MEKEKNINVPLNGDEPYLPAINLIYNWRTTWMRVISRAWVDEEFKKVLFDDAKKAFEMMGYGGTSEIDSNGKVDLWNLLELNVNAAPANPDSEYKQPAESEGKAEEYLSNGWAEAVEKGLLKMELTLTLPPAPEESKWNALALGDYDAAGKIYPLTGC